MPAALDKVIAFLRKQIGGSLPVGVGHRVVHGGPRYSEPTSSAILVLDRARALRPLAPLHQPNNLAPIRAILQRQPHVLQVACFDTAFHRGHPEVADRFAIPEALYAEGFAATDFTACRTNTSHSGSADVAPEIADGRVVVAHLGSGASMCAISAGKSVESTMGFTALDGLPMGTRPGQLDAGVVLYLMSEKKMSAKEIERFLYNDCGLKGLSGISNDVRELLASSDPARQTRARILHLPHRPLYRDARSRDGRHRRLCLHGRDRGERAGHSRSGCAAARLARASSLSAKRMPRANSGSRASVHGSPATSFRLTRS